MARRTKILMICGDINKTRDACIEWANVLDEHLGKKTKSDIEARRIETPFTIIDFVWQKPVFTSGYKVILNVEEDNEKVLGLAIGEESLK